MTNFVWLAAATLGSCVRQTCEVGLHQHHACVGEGIVALCLTRTQRTLTERSTPTLLSDHGAHAQVCQLDYLAIACARARDRGQVTRKVLGSNPSGFSRAADLRGWLAPAPRLSGEGSRGLVHVPGQSAQSTTDRWTSTFLFDAVALARVWHLLCNVCVAGPDVPWTLLGLVVSPRSGEFHAADCLDLHFASGPLSVCFLTCPGHLFCCCP